MTPPEPSFTINPVSEPDLNELLVLVRAYCDFYSVTPTDRDLRAVMVGLLASGGRDGLQVLARDGSGDPVGFATLLFTWSTTGAARAAVMNDLYVAPDIRGHGLAEALIDRCHAESAQHGAAKLTWITRPDNHRAQAVYDRAGASRDPWVTYRMDLPAGASKASGRDTNPVPGPEPVQNLPSLLGVELDHVDGQSVTARLAIRAELQAPTGYLHAATFVALADTACGYGTLAGLPDGATGFTTLELKSNFLATAQHGVLRCHAQRRHGGGTTQVWDAEVTCDQRLLALFRCTQLVLGAQRRPDKQERTT